MCTRACVYAYVRVSVCVRVSACMCVYVCACVCEGCACVRVRVCTCGGREGIIRLSRPSRFLWQRCMIVKCSTCT